MTANRPQLTTSLADRLRQFALHGDPEGELASLAETDLNAPLNSSGDTALLLAVTKRGQEHAAEALLAAGADPNARCNSAVTPLIQVAETGNARLASLLLEAGADVNAKGHDGYTALMIAAIFGQHQVIQVLLEAGSDVNAREPEHGLTALTLADVQGHRKAMRVLRKAGAEY